MLSTAFLDEQAQPVTFRRDASGSAARTEVQVRVALLGVGTVGRALLQRLDLLAGSEIT